MFKSYFRKHKFKECVHRTRIPQLSAEVNRSITPEQKKVVKFKFDLGLPFMVTDIVYKFQMICPKGNLAFEREPNAVGRKGQTWLKLNALDLVSGDITNCYSVIQKFKNSLQYGYNFVAHCFKQTVNLFWCHINYLFH